MDNHIITCPTTIHNTDHDKNSRRICHIKDTRDIGNARNDIFIWKINEQKKYYQIFCNKYIRGIFEHVKNTNCAFYINNLCGELNELNNFNNMRDYLEKGKPVKISDFYEQNYGIDKLLSVTWIDDKIDKNSNMSGCYQCKKKYGAGIYFKGYIYQRNKEPKKYKGYIKTYNFFMCDCDIQNGENKIEYTLQKFPNCSPFVEIRCGSIKNGYGSFDYISNAIQFDIRYQENYLIN